MSVKLTDVAMAKIKEILSKADLSVETTYIRVGIRGQSCSGPVYNFALDEEYDEEYDVLSKQDDVNIVFEKEFSEPLNGIIVDYKSSERGEGFVLTNPLQILSSGGCGSCGSSGGCSSETK